MDVFVTGGAGFIGSHLVRALSQQGYKVRVFDNFSTGQQENLADLDVEIIAGDITDYQLVYQSMAGCSIVFHQAALVSVPRSVADPLINHNSNISGTFNVFEAARQHGIRRVVYASSAAVYGEKSSICTVGDATSPLSPYAVAKRTGELYALAYNRNYGTQFIGLRYFNVYGPGQDPSSPYSGFLSICCDRIHKQTSLTIFGDGEQTRDFVFVQDVVKANLLAGLIAFEQLSGSWLFNVATGRSVSLNKVMETFGEIVGREIVYEYGPVREGDIRYSAADVALTQRWLQFSAEVKLEQGLRATLEWWRQNLTRYNNSH